MQQIILDAEAGQVSAEPARRRIAAAVRVHVAVGIWDPDEPPLAAIAQAGQARDWPAEAPDLSCDADLRERAG